MPSEDPNTYTSDDAGRNAVDIDSPPEIERTGDPGQAGSTEATDAADTYRTGFSENGTAPSIAVVEAVSAVTDRAPEELTPLRSVIDPDALDNLFSRLNSGGPRNEGRVKFAYDGFEVSLHSRGRIAVTPLERKRSGTP